MVFLTRILLEAARHRRFPMHSCIYFGREQPAPDARWKRRKVFMLTSHMYGRKRNCFSVAARGLQKSLQAEYKQDGLKHRDLQMLYEQRIEAGAGELDFDGSYLKDALARSHLHISDEMLANLAIWEPRSFRAVVGLAADKAMQGEEMGGAGMLPCGPGVSVVWDRRKE